MLTVQQYIQNLKIKLSNKKVWVLIALYGLASLLCLFVSVQNSQKTLEISTSSFAIYNLNLAWLGVSVIFWLNLLIGLGLGIYNYRFNLFFGTINLFFLFFIYSLIFNEMFFK